MNNEDLSNEWQENTPVNQEISPWLHKRLEERAHPLNFRAPDIDRLAMVSTSYQKLLRSTGKSNQVVDSILGRVRQAPGTFQADRLPLISRAFSGIISRTISIGTSNLYKMLNLPWFRPKRGHKPEPVNDSGLVVRQGMLGDSADKLNDTVLLPETKSVEDKGREKPGKTPETYIDYMISSPIARKRTMSINNLNQDSVLRKSPSLTTGNITETHNLTGTERNNRNLSRISGSIDRSVTNKEVPPDRFSIQHDNSTANETGYPSPRSEEKNMGRVTATGEDTKRVEAIDYRSSHSEGKDTGQVTAINEDTKRVETVDYPSSHKEEQDTGKVTATGTEVTKPDISSKSKGDKGSSVYPVMNLFYEKSMPIVRKIVRSLPFARNIQRKEISPGESVDQPVDRNQTGQDVNREHSDNLEIVSHHNESPGETPVNADLPTLPYVTGTETKDSNINQEFQNTGNEIQAFELQEPNKSAISRKTGISIGTTLAYTAKDLFYRTPLPLSVTGRLVRSLPLVNSIQPKPVLSGVPTKQSTGRKQTEQGDNIRSAKNLETSYKSAVHAGAYKPVQESPLISREITTATSEPRRNGIASRDSLTPVPDFIIPVDNSLDLTLAPVNRMPAIQHREEYLQIDQPSAEALIARPTQQIQRAETQRSETTREAAAESHENSTGINENIIDFRTIARETYPFIRRMIMVERERRPSR